MIGWFQRFSEASGLRIRCTGVIPTPGQLDAETVVADRLAS
jgi:hypothetical protein